jgi:threonine synthase
MDYLAYLECSYCGKDYDAGELHTLCPACQKPLLARYDLDRVKKDWTQESLW